MAKTVKARWVGTCEAQLPDKTHLIPGETVVQIPAAEAEESDNWERVGGGQKVKVKEKADEGAED